LEWIEDRSTRDLNREQSPNDIASNAMAIERRAWDGAQRR